MRALPPRAVRIGRFVFIAAVVAAVALAFQQSWNEIVETGVPPASVLAIAVVLLAGALGAGAYAYSWLFGPDVDRNGFVRAFALAAPCKYLPLGGFAQLGTQVMLSARGGVGALKAATNSGIQMYLIVVIRVGVGGLVFFFADGIDSRVRLFAVAAPIALVGLYRPVLVRIVGAMSRVSRRFPKAEDVAPADALTRSTAYTVLNLVANEVAFALLLLHFAPDVPLGQALGGFAWAWVIGFLALPLPAGLGVREAVLYFLIPAASGPAILAASVAHRVLIIGVESAAALVMVLARRPERQPVAVGAR